MEDILALKQFDSKTSSYFISSLLRRGFLIFNMRLKFEARKALDCGKSTYAEETAEKMNAGGGKCQGKKYSLALEYFSENSIESKKFY